MIAGSGVHLGPYSLTVPQSVAWHGDDALERETIRRDIRRTCRARLAAQRLEHSITILDVGDVELERVTSVDLGPHRPFGHDEGEMGGGRP